MPQQNPEKYERIAAERQSLRPSGGGNTASIAIGAIMLLVGIVASTAGTGRVFIGLIVFGAITLIRGLAGK